METMTEMKRSILLRPLIIWQIFRVFFIKYLDVQFISYFAVSNKKASCNETYIEWQGKKTQKARSNVGVEISHIESIWYYTKISPAER